MFENLRDFIRDKKRLSHLTGACNRVLVNAESAGLFARAPAFMHDYSAEYEGLAELEANHSDVRGECERLVHHRDRLVDVENLAGKYTAGGIHAIVWKSFMFKSGSFIPENCRLASRTAELLRGVPGLYTAFFSILDPNQYITPHWGYWKGFLRYHLGVIVPNDNADGSCWLRVNAAIADNAVRDTKLIERGEKYFWKEGKGVMFDDTFLHDAKNGSSSVRVVLWLDIRRRMPVYLHAANVALLEIAHRSPGIRAVRKNAVARFEHAF
jgi:beta-hydroxylase